MKNNAVKKSLSLVLFVVMLFCTVAPFAAAVELPLTFTANGKNSSRGAGTIIIYDQDGTTGTNRYGYEVTVDSSGKIISKGGNNSVIPEDGFVLSGHEQGAQYLKDNTEIGMYASYCPLTLEVTLDTCRHLPFGSKTVELSAINSHRSSNYLVVYTPDFKYATTGTNRWGNEAIVEDGIITSIGGNNNKIPENGFVISAVENALSWFYDALSIGVSAYYSEEDKTLTVSYDMNSMIYSDRNKLQGLNAQLEDAGDEQAAVSAYNEAQQLLESAIAKYNNDGDAAAYVEFSTEFSHTIDEAAALCYPTCDKEIRGTWYSPREKTRAEVDSVVGEMYSLGLNSLSLLGFSDGMFLTSVPSGSPFTSALDLGQEDIIRYFIEACHQRNMKFSLWMPVFYAGYTSSKYLVTKTLPDLQVRTQNNTTDSSGGLVFLDPSNSDATSLLLSTYEHILSNYDIDVFELDYIRYSGASGSLDFGYHTTAQSDFIEQYGETPVYDRTWHLWKEWCQCRASYITDFVGDMHELIGRVKPDTLLSADVFGSDDTVYSIYQDWQTWTQRGYIDILIPMLYGVNYFKDNIGIFAKAVKDANYILVPGLSVSGDDVPPEVLAGQIVEARKNGASGVNFFAFPASYKCRNPRIIDGVFKAVAEYPLSFFTVTFTDSSGAVLSTQTVKCGTAATAPELQAPADPHEVFERWSSEFSCVNGDITVSAVYSRTDCVDENGDKLCDICSQQIGSSEEPNPPTQNCSCYCHSGGMMSFFWKIINFFNKLFGIRKTCACGVSHY